MILNPIRIRQVFWLTLLLSILLVPMAVLNAARSDEGEVQLNLADWLPEDTVAAAVVRPAMVNAPLRQVLGPWGEFDDLVRQSGDVRSITSFLTDWRCVGTEDPWCMGVIVHGNDLVEGTPYDQYLGYDIRLADGGYQVTLAPGMVAFSSSPDLIGDLIAVAAGRASSWRQGGPSGVGIYADRLAPRAALSIVMPTPDRVLEGMALSRYLLRMADLTVGVNFYATISLTIDGAAVASFGDLLGVAADIQSIGMRAYATVELAWSDEPTALLVSGALRLAAESGEDLIETFGIEGISASGQPTIRTRGTRTVIRQAISLPLNPAPMPGVAAIQKLNPVRWLVPLVLEKERRG